MIWGYHYFRKPPYHVFIECNILVMDKVLVNVRNKPLKKSLPDTVFLLKMTLIQICELLVVIVYRKVTQMNTCVMHGDAYNMKKHIHEYPHPVQHCAVRCFVRCPIQFLHPCQRTWRLENCMDFMIIHSKSYWVPIVNIHTCFKRRFTTFTADV